MLLSGKPPFYLKERPQKIRLADKIRKILPIDRFGIAVSGKYHIPENAQEIHATVNEYYPISTDRKGEISTKNEAIPSHENRILTNADESKEISGLC